MRFVRSAIAFLALALLLAPATSRATFHLWEITKIMTSFEGDASVQAVEMKQLAANENLVGTAFLQVYSPTGVAGATLGTVPADLAPAGAGARFLWATMKFKQKFGITPDVQISAGLLATNGQVVFDKPLGCQVNGVAYGSVSVPVVGNVSSATPIPSAGNAPVLVRVTDNATFPSCPQAEDAAAKFRLVTATAAAPVSFTNYSGVTVNVSSAVTGAEGTPAVAAPRAYPNPFRDRLHVETAGPASVTVYDVRGALVARLGTAGAGPSHRVTWDGRDARGRRAPEGVYFIGIGERESRVLRRVVLIR